MRANVSTDVVRGQLTVQGLGVGRALLKTVIDLADNWLNLKRIELTVYVDNERAINLYKKFGFEIEGESKAYALVFVVTVLCGNLVVALSAP